MAIRAARAARERTPSFAYTRVRWYSIVFGLQNSLHAAWRLVAPDAISCATRISCAVSPAAAPSGCARGPVSSFSTPASQPFAPTLANVDAALLSRSREAAGLRLRRSAEPATSCARASSIGVSRSAPPSSAVNSSSTAHSPSTSTRVRATTARCKASGSAGSVANQLASAASASAAFPARASASLDYPTALHNGWPIATGVIEGACRHLVKDRMDITGARWGLSGAEAILKLRALHSNGDFDTYWRYHLAQERRRVHESRYLNGHIPQAA